MEIGTCKLTFSSFDGGGYKYKVIIEDPEILTYEMKYDYGDQPDDEPIDGASFDVVIIFQGLKPGTTGLTIACSSPIADNYDLLYQASVDESLNVTLTGEQMISYFLLSRSGEEIDDYYVLEFTEEECFLSADGESFQKVEKAVMSALYDVYEAYDVRTRRTVPGRDPPDRRDLCPSDRRLRLPGSLLRSHGEMEPDPASGSDRITIEQAFSWTRVSE